MKSICIKCISETNHQVLHEFCQNLSEEETGWWEDHSYQIIRCLGCDSISFRKLYNDAAQQQVGDYSYDGKKMWTQEVYPKRTLCGLSFQHLTSTPTSIRYIYNETIDAFNNNQFILCSAGLRAIVEGICNDRNIEGGEIFNKKKNKLVYSKNLDGKIEGLATKEVLTRKNAQILHNLRFLGNEAIHELTEPSSEELKVAISIIEHIIQDVYLFEHKGKILKAETEKRKKKE